MAWCVGGLSICARGWGGVPRQSCQQALSRELGAMGYCKLSARPRRHAQAEGAIEDSKMVPRPHGGSRAEPRDRSADISVDPLYLHLLRHLSQVGQGSSPCLAPLQHSGGCHSLALKQPLAARPNSSRNQNSD